MEAAPRCLHMLDMKWRALALDVGYNMEDPHNTGSPVYTIILQPCMTPSGACEAVVWTHWPKTTLIYTQLCKLPFQHVSTAGGLKNSASMCTSYNPCYVLAGVSMVPSFTISTNCTPMALKMTHVAQYFK